jgi:integrase
VLALQTWLKLARIGHGPLFRPVTGNGKEAGPERLTDKQAARLVRRAALAADACASISPKASVRRNFPGIRCAAASPPRPRSNERYVQKQLGHTSAEMTRRYQRRRERSRVNLAKAIGLWGRSELMR